MPYHVRFEEIEAIIRGKGTPREKRDAIVELYDRICYRSSGERHRATPILHRKERLIANILGIKVK